MNPTIINSTLNESSTINFQVHLTQDWIQKLADEKDMQVTLTEQYQLHHFIVKLQPGRIDLEAEIVDKPGSWIQVSCAPLWMVDEQRIALENLEIHTQSKNLLVKTAGWVASKILGEKIDRKIEEKVNQMFHDYLQKLLSQPFLIPIKGHGQVEIKPDDLKILQIIIEEGNAGILVQVVGKLNINLDGMSAVK